MTALGHRTVTRGYTMIELIAAAGLLVILATSALNVLHTTWVHSRNAARNTVFCGETALLRKHWRAHVHRSLAPVSAKGGQLQAGNNWSAQVEGNMLVLRRGVDTTSLPIPVGMSAALSEESGRAVLTTSWKSGPSPRHSLRIVARPRPKNSEATP